MEVRREGGFDGAITLVSDATYFDRFDFNQLYPEPASVSPRGEEVLYVFEEIDGEVLRVAFDGRASPTFVFALARGSTGLEAGRRLTEDEVVSAAREQGIGDIADVRFGVLEPDGKFSFVRFDREHAPPSSDRHGE